MEKQCSKCKSTDNKFSKDKTSKDGYSSICQPCRKQKYDETKHLFNDRYNQNRKPKRKEYYQNNKEKLLEDNKDYRERTRAERKLARANYYEVNKTKIREKSAKYKKENPNKVNFWGAKRRAAKLYRTPKWADMESIKEFYMNCPKGYSVDHIIPLQSKLVSGFHCVENLQYLTHEQNMKKHNSFEPEFIIAQLKSVSSHRGRLT